MARIFLRSFLCCCLLATVAQCEELEMSPVLKKRISTWLGGRLKRYLDSVNAEKTGGTRHFIRSEDVRDTLLPHSSADINVRTKRSAGHSRRQGCAISTCTVHLLAHRLHDFHMRMESAPPEKISPTGYGRRRRSLPPRRLTLRRELGRLRPVWRTDDSQVRKLKLSSEGHE